MIEFTFWLSLFIILYTYFGYPILLALLARTRPKVTPPASYSPKVTLLIAAYNEENVIAHKINNCLELEYPPDQLQILVAADGSDDCTVEIVRAFSQRGVELNFQPKREGKMAAINHAMTKASGEIVILSDANNMYERSTLQYLVAPFADPKIGLVHGAKHILKSGDGLSESENLYWKYESYIKQQETRLGSCTSAVAEILAIRRSLFSPAPRGVINDDFYLALSTLKKGYRVFYTDQARSYEYVSLSAKDEMERRARISAGRYQALAHQPKLLPYRQPVLLWQLISHKVLRLFLPFAMLGLFFANFAAIFQPRSSAKPSLFLLHPPYNWIFFSGQVLFYMLALLGSLRLPRNNFTKVAYLATFLTNSNIALLQGFIRFLKKKDTPLWRRVRRREDLPRSNHA